LSTLYLYIKCRNFVKFCLQKAALKVLREFKSKTEPGIYIFVSYYTYRKSAIRRAK
jgi:hypothetical protein